ncbi:MAG TPA: hypothetical protein VFU02_10575 [Polyangiaceae bacterium]|nr:hypothetical protein [Polyangiaceae bacterium]
MSRTSVTGILTAAALSLGVAGCEEDHPYTPFQVASAVPSATVPAAAPAEAEPAAPVAFSASGPIARPKAPAWQLGARRIQAPPGYEIERGLEADFDGNGVSEIVVWLVPAADSPARPELWLYPAAGTPRKLFPLPGFVPTGPNCRLQTLLLHTGPKTVTLDTKAVCDARLIARAPVRSLVVLAPTADHPEVLALRAAEGSPREELKLNVASLDRDGDGRDDVTLQASLDTRQAASAVALAKFVWYDREAGTSRDDTEPGLSMAQLASREIVRAKGQSTSRNVHPTIQNLKRLYAAVCDEAGTPRLFDEEGNGLACGRLTTTFSRATEAEIAALLKNGQVLEALGVLERADWFGHQASPKDRERWLGLFQGKLVRKQARLRRELGLSVPREGTQPSLSPLEFTGDTLEAQTRDGVRSFALDGSERRLEDGGTPPNPWPLRAEAPGGGRLWTGVVYSCDRSEVALSFVDGSGQPLAPVLTEILAPRPGNCRGGAAVEAPAVPIGWVDAQLVAWVGGARIGPAEPRTRPKGSPRSLNGEWTVLPSRLGLLVTGTQHELWQVPESVGQVEQLRACVIHDSGRLVACVTPDGFALIESEAVSR